MYKDERMVEIVKCPICGTVMNWWNGPRDGGFEVGIGCYKCRFGTYIDVKDNDDEISNAKRCMAELIDMYKKHLEEKNGRTAETD